MSTSQIRDIYTEMSPILKKCTRHDIFYSAVSLCCPDCWIESCQNIIIQHKLKNVKKDNPQ